MGDNASFRNCIGVGDSERKGYEMIKRAGKEVTRENASGLVLHILARLRCQLAVASSLLGDFRFIMHDKLQNFLQPDGEP